MTLAPQSIAAIRPAARPARPTVAPTVHRHQLSRWHAAPLAAWLAERLVASRVRPVHVTCLGFVLTVAACSSLVAAPAWSAAAAVLIWAAWLCDRLDGALARRQATATRYGAWLDANLDELSDVLLQGALAWQLAATTAAWPWALFAAFVAGKYLFVAGQRTEEALEKRCQEPFSGKSANRFLTPFLRLYHAPGDADVRVHLLLAAVLAGWLSAELAIVAAYYNLRWMVRYGLVARRLGGEAT